MFGSYGQVDRVSIMTDRDTGRSRGFGFVEMANAEEGEKAIAGLNGSEIGGRTLNVNEARPKTEHGEAVDVTGTVVAVVEIAAGGAEAEAAADAISRVLSQALLTAENLSRRKALCPQCKPSSRARKRSVPPFGFH